MSKDADRFPLGSSPTELLRRLRVRSLSSWDHGDRAQRTRSALAELALLGARAEHLGAAPQVPDAGVHALVDQLEVLIADALRAGVPASEVDRILNSLAEELGVAL